MLMVLGWLTSSERCDHSALWTIGSLLYRPSNAGRVVLVSALDGCRKSTALEVDVADRTHWLRCQPSRLCILGAAGTTKT